MCVKPSQPRRMPITSRPISFERYTTLLMTGFSPGTSPPPVKIPIRFFAPIDPYLPLGFVPAPELGRRSSLATRHSSLVTRHFQISYPISPCKE